MPYIVTTLSPCHPPEAGHDVSRRAVATLNEARGAVIQAIPEECPGLIPAKAIAVATQIAHLSEIGGTVGPLPGGTVIEVTPTTISDIADTFSMDTFNAMNYEGASQADWIAAFNARDSCQGKEKTR